ncbi:MAG: SRPBCC family protein [Burkholderiaceae bacterium]
MRVLRRLALWLGSLLVLLVLIGFFLPDPHPVERSRLIAQPQEKIWAMLVDPRAWNRWAPWFGRDPDMKITYIGAPSGVGARWRWASNSEGNGEMQFIAATAPRQLDYALSFDGMGSAIGKFVLEPATGGTKVSWQFQSDPGLNPLGRWFGLFLDRLVGPDFEQGLSNLEKLLQTQSG